MTNKTIAMSMAALLGCSLALTAAASKPALKLDNDADKASYGIGINIGNSLKAQSFRDINLEAVYQGIGDAVTDKPMKVSKEALVDAFATIQKQEAQEKMKVAKRNLRKGESFLQENGKKKGVKTTDSGLQYKVLAEGKGPKPAASDVVVTNYRGTLIDGTEFDSSYKRNEPVEFPVNRVIPGWTEALQMMPVGSKWQLYIPAKLAYGEFSPSPAIPPNSTLIFDVELLEIKAKSGEKKEG